MAVDGRGSRNCRRVTRNSEAVRLLPERFPPHASKAAMLFDSVSARVALGPHQGWLAADP